MRIPSYRLHKASGQAVVTLNGVDHYLGKHGTLESKAEYDRLIAIWTGGGRQPLKPKGTDVSINEIILGFYRWAEGYYRKGDKPTSQVATIRAALKDLRTLFGIEPASQFGPIKLDTLRSHWVAGGVSRDLVNRRVKIVRQAFKWAASRELVPASVWKSLNSLPGLARGRSQARETLGVAPVPDVDIEALLGHLDTFPDVHPRRTLAAMIRLQLLTGMRPGEVVAMHTDDFDTSGDVWIYRPRNHKTQHRDKTRTIYLGPQAQGIIMTHVWPDPGARGLLFRSPRKARYTRNSYREAIARACWDAGVRIFVPSHLRHNYATMIRKELGLEASKIMLGHSRVETTQIYAEADEKKAMDVARQFG